MLGKCHLSLTHSQPWLTFLSLSTSLDLDLCRGGEVAPPALPRRARGLCARREALGKGRQGLVLGRAQGPPSTVLQVTLPLPPPALLEQPVPPRPGVAGLLAHLRQEVALLDRPLGS